MGLWFLMLRSVLQIVVPCVLCGLLFQMDLAAQENKKTATLAIIAGTNFPKDQMTKKELKTIYLGETQLLKDLWIHPVDQRENQPIRKNFLEQVVNMTRDRYIDYWNQRLFRYGGFSPLLKGNSREVIETIREQDGALGYVWLEETRNESGIKILLTLDIP
jgi:ABC-type phosphate transport system substrate-binding protein